MNSRIALLLCSLCLIQATAQGQGRVTTLENTLTLDQAMIRVLENHPILQRRDYEAQAIAARMRQARLAPADRINVSLEEFAGSGNASGFKGVEATLSLSRTLELGNKAVIRGDIVEFEQHLLSNQKDIDRLDLLTETARRFLHVAADQERLRIAEEAIDLIRLTEATVEKRIAAGRTPVAERQRVLIDLANQELELDHVKHEMESSRISLATLWNNIQPDFESISADIFSFADLPDFSVLADLLDRNPDLVRYLRSEDLARSQIRLAQSQRKPDIQIAPGLRYLSNGDDVAFVVSASIPLGSANRARHEIEAAEALAMTEPLNHEQKRLELYATLFELYQELKHAKDAVETLRQRIIPAATKMLAAYDDGFQSGRYALLELVQVQQMVLDAHAEALEMAVNYHGYRIEIDRLTGAQLGQW